MAEKPDDPKLDVFISYARHDAEVLADELATALDVIGFRATLDRHDIAAAEDWEQRLERLIQNADTIVFLLSPEAVRSKRCAWEVATARRLSKRLIPVVAARVPDDAVPVELRRLNYIYFDAGHSFARALGQLADALRVDVGWIREHTRLGDVAGRWDARGRPEAMLLRGDELTAAQTWAGARQPDAVHVTDAQRAFIVASADAEAARTNRERQQLEEMARAQTGRAEALQARERALQTVTRRTVIGGAAAAALSSATAAIGVVAMRSAREADAQRQRADLAQQQSLEAAIHKEAARTDLEGQLVAYAASPGQLALDSIAGEENSPFTTILLEELRDQSTSLQNALARSNRRVLDKTSMSQRPYLSTDLNGDVYLRRRPESRQCRAVVISVDAVAGSPTLHWPNVERDALAWEAFLKEAGFDVQRLKNPGGGEILRTLTRAGFAASGSQRSAPNTCLMMFFSGGGFQRGVTQYLVASDTRLSARTGIASGVSVSELAGLMRTQAAASLLVLDTAFPDV